MFGELKLPGADSVEMQNLGQDISGQVCTHHCSADESHCTCVCTCTGVTGSTKGAARAGNSAVGYLRVGSSRGISHSAGMVEISMVFQVFTPPELNKGNTFSLTIGRH